jgi:hypothetical protein
LSLFFSFVIFVVSNAKLGLAQRAQKYCYSPPPPLTRLSTTINCALIAFYKPKTRLSIHIDYKMLSILYFLMAVAQWMCAKVTGAVAALFSTTLLFPAYLLSSLEKAASEWQRFFLSDIPWFFGSLHLPILNFFLWLTLGAFFVRLLARDDDTPLLPTTADEDGSNDLKKGLQSDVAQEEPRPKPLPRVHLGNFEPTTDYFTKAGFYYPPTWGTPLRHPLFSDSFVAYSGPSTVEVGPVTPTSIVEAGEVQCPAPAAIQPAEQVVAITPPDRHMVLVSSPAEVHQPLPVAAPVLEGVPPSFTMICQEMAVKKDELEQDLQSILLGVDEVRDISAERQRVTVLLDGAYRHLTAHRSRLTAEEAALVHWTSSINFFWGRIQPHGYELFARYQSEMKEMESFLSGVFLFGRYLQLPLKELEMSPPPAQIEHEVLPVPEVVAAPPPTSLPDLPNIFNFDAPSHFGPQGQTFSSTNQRRAGRARTVAKPTGAFRAGISKTGKPSSGMTQAAASLSAASICEATVAPSQQPAVSQMGVGTPHITTPGPSTEMEGKPSEETAVPPQEAALPMQADTPAKKASLSMAANRLDEWATLDTEELLALTKEDWGWTGNSLLWTYSGMPDLNVDDNKARAMRGSHVLPQLEGVAVKLIRAIVVLRAQATAKDWAECVSDAPQLLQNIQALLKKASTMYYACGGEIALDVWCDAMLFLSDGVCEKSQRHIRSGLRQQYGREIWDEFWMQWRAVEYLWLGEDEG